MKYVIIIVVFALIKILNAQVDTTTYYPLHIGDKWEYYSPGNGYRTVEITGDTLMPNGHIYFEFSMNNRKYQRVDNNRYVMIFNKSNDTEFIEYDLEANKTEIWELEFPYYQGVYDRGIDSSNLLHQKLEWKEYRGVYVDTTVFPPDTVWDNVVDGYWPRITKGLGVTTYAHGLEVLVGSVINGVSYGTLVGIFEPEEIKFKNFRLNQNYPNPFNSITKIEYSIPNKSYINISVFNLIGKKIKTLYEGTQKGGEYTISFDGAELPSGVYYIRLYSKGYIQSIKALLLK